MKNGPYAMPGESRTDSITRISSGFIYSPANGIEWSAWSTCFDASFECSICHSHEVSARFVDVSDEERLRGITMISVQVNCYIDVNYIPILERPAITC